MTPFAFDTLSASKRLREAGMAEGVAEAVVAVFQHATASVDFSLLATKADLLGLATKADIADMATKADIAAIRAEMATKADITAVRAEMATKSDLLALEVQVLRDVRDSMRGYTVALIGGIGTIVGIATAVIKLVP